MKKAYQTILILLATIGLLSSCTKLNEKILDESSVTGLSDKQIADGLIAPVYARLPDIFRHTTYFALQEISTDEAILPYRGGTDWGDNGIYLSLHRHETTSTDPNVNDTWNLIVQEISRSLTALNSLKDNKDPNAPEYIAEARGMRAFYNMLSLDLFGIVFVKDEPTAVSKIIRAGEAVDYLKNELLAVEPLLGNDNGPGRLTKAGVWGLLTKLYLNAAVYRDRYADNFNFRDQDLDSVIMYSDKIINLKKYELSPDYFAIFGNENHTNKELIFAVDQRPDLNGHNRLAYFSLSGDQYPLPQYPAANGTDGPAITSDFYQTWVHANEPIDPAKADPRFYKQNISIYTNPGDSCVSDFNEDRGILRGQQYGLLRVNGAFVKCDNGLYKVGKLYNASRSNPNLPVNFTEIVDFTTEGSNYSTGYRVEKYEFSRSSTSGRNFGEADISIIRLADIYLMRAEAKLRKNDVAGALEDVNTVRLSRTAYAIQPTALNSLNLDLLFRERGFEFYWEMLRRTDMVRFGKYEGSWTEKTNTDKNKRIFPIPQNAIDGASNLPDYLVQNPGY
ncbi:RagB/SusD family nutrient uptake outer membrane protein [Hanamia caeni]|uniref:RagB/SusD family nutrient uptake outer membrane protein n=1 Tax=Hanamia caeni TaxID=2294116 RepID=A0A3M9N698_9BACT|nr:RagB/SusD family nutrient uptake outer membrane protein [Hanamia caeni]RNI33322.1 RagB/SusD family nutrient uptake outer membrane protein [Hanamia caeni]